MVLTWDCLCCSKASFPIVHSRWMQRTFIPLLWCTRLVSHRVVILLWWPCCDDGWPAIWHLPFSLVNTVNDFHISTLSINWVALVSFCTHKGFFSLVKTCACWLSGVCSLRARPFSLKVHSLPVVETAYLLSLFWQPSSDFDLHIRDPSGHSFNVLWCLQGTGYGSDQTVLLKLFLAKLAQTFTVSGLADVFAPYIRWNMAIVMLGMLGLHYWLTDSLDCLAPAFS